jgi:flagellar biosynthesis/type III secretory pathway protein FliH
MIMEDLLGARLRPEVVAHAPCQAGAGILYIEDFDEEDVDRVSPPAEATAQVFSERDVEEAREAGRLAGLDEARTEIAAVQGQLRLSVLTTVTDMLRGTRQEVEKLAENRAWDLSATVLAVLTAALPATASRHARGEIEAIFKIVLPGLRCEPELCVRVHPEQEADASSALSSLLADQPTAVTVRGDPALAPSDVVMTWRDGSARRDCAVIWNHIANALAPLGLPTFQEIAHGG